VLSTAGDPIAFEEVAGDPSFIEMRVVRWAAHLDGEEFVSAWVAWWSAGMTTQPCWKASCVSAPWRPAREMQWEQIVEESVSPIEEAAIWLPVT